MAIRAATDAGGTFTDLVYYEVDANVDGAGELKTAKVDTTPPNFEKGVMNVLAKGNVQAKSIDFFAHGATIVINAITERKGVKVGLITTEGFRDVLEIARGNRPDLFNFSFRKPAPFVARHLRQEVLERTNYKGEVEISPALEQIPKILEHFRTEGVEAIAICFLHAYITTSNEQLVAERIRALWPEVSVIASHEITREWREYERTSTAVISAYIHPVTKRYVEALESRLRDEGYRAPVHMMLSAGGIATVAAAKKNPISMVESGPASGIHAAAYFGKLLGKNNLIVLDIGGTTAKCTLIDEGHVHVTSSYYIERTPKNPGYPLQTAVADIVEIGNGGGSIAWIDAGGKMHVGPKSAGAVPGPVAYGRGGRQPTTTDANLLLGRINPASFAGGEVTPDWDAVRQAFAALGNELKVSAVEAARGVLRIANANMTNALRLVSTNKGYDPRDFSLIAFGGGGPMHAVALARELQIPHVIVPVHSSVFSALGMLLTDLRRDYIRTRVLPLNAASINAIEAQIDEIRNEALAEFVAEATNPSEIKVNFEVSLDLRYMGQEHTVKVPAMATLDDAGVAQTISAFHAAHEKRFTYRLSNGVEVVSFHVVASVGVPKPSLPKRAMNGLKVEDACIGLRSVDFDEEGVQAAHIYDGRLLNPSSELVGPAIVQEPSVTVVVPPGVRLQVDEFGNYHLYLNDLGATP